MARGLSVDRRQRERVSACRVLEDTAAPLSERNLATDWLSLAPREFFRVSHPSDRPPHSLLPVNRRGV